MSIFRKLGWFFRQERKHYYIGVAALVLVALVQLAPPKVIGIIIDEIAEKDFILDRYFACRCISTIYFSFCLADKYLGEC